MERTFLFADLAGFTALTETHGDETGADLAERFSRAVGDVLEGDGRLVATIGDAAFVVTNEPRSALGILKRLLRRLEDEKEFPAVRAGLHHGDAAERGGQFYGTAVNVAARVAAQARAGQVLGTERIAASARSAGMAVRSLGSVGLKNLRESLELFTIDLGLETRPELIDPVCRMRVVPERAGAHLVLEGVDYWFCSPACLRIFVAEKR